MISGALFLRPEKEITLHDVFHRYIKRILICYAAWAALYSLLYTAMYGGDAKYFILHLFQLPAHLWYLLLLVSLYLATPILKRVASDRSVTLYMIRLLLVFGFVFGTLSGISGSFSGIAGENYGFSLWMAFLRDLDILNMTFVPGYMAFYLMGHYIHEYGLGKWHRIFVAAAIPALLLSAAVTLLLSRITGQYIYTLMMETNPLIFVSSAGIFAFFRGPADRERRYDAGSPLTKAVTWIGARSFGLYLVHLAVMNCLDFYLNFNAASYPACFSVPLNSLLVFVLSLAIAAVLKKIPLLRKIVS